MFKGDCLKLVSFPVKAPTKLHDATTVYGTLTIPPIPSSSGEKKTNSC